MSGSRIRPTAGAGCGRRARNPSEKGSGFPERIPPLQEAQTVLPILRVAAEDHYADTEEDSNLPQWNSIQREVTSWLPENHNLRDDTSLHLGDTLEQQGQEEIEPCIKTGTAELSINGKDQFIPDPTCKPKEGSVCLDVNQSTSNTTVTVAQGSTITTTQKIVELPSKEFSFADQEVNHVPFVMKSPELKPSLVQHLQPQSEQGREQLSTCSQPSPRPSGSKLDSLFGEEEDEGHDDLFFLGGPSKKTSATAKTKAKSPEAKTPSSADPLSQAPPPQARTKEVKGVTTSSSSTDKEDLFSGSQTSSKQPQTDEGGLFSDPLLGSVPIVEAAAPAKPPAKLKPKPKTKQDDLFGDSGSFARSGEEKTPDPFLDSGKRGPTEPPPPKPKASNSPKVPKAKPKSSGLGGLFDDDLSDDDLFSVPPAKREKEPPGKKIPPGAVPVYGGLGEVEKPRDRDEPRPPKAQEKKSDLFGSSSGLFGDVGEDELFSSKPVAQKKVDNIPLPGSTAETARTETPSDQAENDETAKETLSRYFLKACTSNPDATVLMTHDTTYSNHWLYSSALRTQSLLQEVGVQRSQVVAIYMPRGPRLMAAALGCVLHGAVFLLLDPSLPAQRIALQLKVARPSLLLCSPHTYARATASPISARSLLALQVSLEFDTYEEFCTHPQSQSFSMSSKPDIEYHMHAMKVTETFKCGDDVLYIIFTSGSTGFPKAVCASATGTLNRFEWMWKEFPFQKKDVLCFKTSVLFVDCIWEILGGVLKGVPLVIASEDEAKDPRLLASLIRKCNVTRSVFVPSYLKVLLENSSTLENLQSLTLCVSSGELLTTNLALKFCSALPACRLLNLYGTSEVCGDVTCFEVTPQYLQQNSTYMFVPIGRPIWNVSIKVVDPHDEVSSNSSTRGELLVYGECVAHSYLNCNDETLHGNVRAFRTLDMVHFLPCGNLMYVGRLDFQMKVRGVRINPGEVEAILEEHRDVLQAVVVPGEPGMSLRAYVKINNIALLSDETASVLHYKDVEYFASSNLSEVLSTYLLGIVPEFQVPSSFIFAQKLPCLPSGKLSRQGLPPSKEVQKLFSAPSREGPQQLSKTEKQICCIFKEVLSLDNVSLSSNFFNLGGHSLLAIELASRVEGCSGCKLSISTVLSNPTVQSLAAYIETQTVKEHFSVNVTNIVGTTHHTFSDFSEGPLSYIQEAMWVSQSVYSQSDVLVVKIAAVSLQPIITEHLQMAIQQLAVKHESLRTIFPCAKIGRPYQKVIASSSPAFLQLLGSAFVITDCSKECPLRFEGGQVHLPSFDFKLEAEPPWRFSLFTNVAFPGSFHSSTILALQIHHIITDGWSLKILTRELEDNYQKYVCGEEFMQSTESFSSTMQTVIKHTLAEYDQIKNDTAIETKLQYWEEKLSNAAPVPFLQPDRLLFSVTMEYHANIVFKEFTSISLPAVQAFCQSNGITEFVFTFASLLAAIHALTGSEDIIAFIAIANRTTANVNLTAPLVDILPLRTLIDCSATLQSLLHSVSRSLLELLKNALPFHYIEKQLLRKGKILPNAKFLSTLPYQLLFVLDYAEVMQFSDSSLFKNIPVYSRYSDFCMDIYVSMNPKQNCFCAQVMYSTGLYNPEKVDTLLELWETVLQTFLDQSQLDLPLWSLSQKFQGSASGGTEIHENKTGTTSDQLHLQAPDLTETNDGIAISLGDNVTWHQFKAIWDALPSTISGIAIPGHPKIAIVLPFSALAIAIIASVTNFRLPFFFTSSLEDMCKSLLEEENTLVISSSDNLCQIKAFVVKEELNDISMVPVESLFQKRSSHAYLLQSSVVSSSMQRTGVEDIPNKSHKWYADIRACFQIIASYFSETTCISNAAVFTCPESSTFPIAISLLLLGVSVQVCTNRHLDTSSFVHVMNTTMVSLLVVPEIILPRLLSALLLCEHLQQVWVYGMPFGLAHLASFRNLHIMVTHTLVPETNFITHHFKLSDVVVPIEEEDCNAYIPIGKVCQGLEWKLLHRDGRTILPGCTCIGDFTTVTDGHMCRSGILVRHYTKDSSFELISLNAEMYYKGQDVISAVTILSRMPEVTWCHVAIGTDRDPHLYYAVVEDHASDSLKAASLHKTVSMTVSDTYVFPSIVSNLSQLSHVPPVTQKLSLDHSQLQSLSRPLLPPEVNAEEKRSIQTNVGTVISKVFEVDIREAERCTDLVAIGGWSLAQLLNLTVELNTEFSTTLTVSDVQLAMSTRELTELISESLH